jgi:hypothetical protein
MFVVPWAAPLALTNSKASKWKGSSPKKAAPRSNGNENQEGSGNPMEVADDSGLPARAMWSSSSLGLRT